MAKLVILYGHPPVPAAFEEYYANRHRPYAAKHMPNVPGAENMRVISAAETSKQAAGKHRPVTQRGTRSSPVPRRVISTPGRLRMLSDRLCGLLPADDRPSQN